MNTRIGWPWEYWQHGFWPFMGFLAFCSLIATAFYLIGRIDERKNTATPLAYFTLALFVLAFGLLQALPSTSSGIQVVPLAPWQYSGWLPRILSIPCWIFAILAVGFASHPRDNCPVAACLFAMFMLILTPLLSFWQPESSPEASPATFHHALDRLETLRVERANAMATLEGDRKALVERIRSLDLRSRQELMADKVGRALVEELAVLSRQIGQVKKETGIIDETLDRAHSRLRCLERQATVRSLGAEDYEQMSRLDHELEDGARSLLRRPTPEQEVTLDHLLGEVPPPCSGRIERAVERNPSENTLPRR